MPSSAVRSCNVRFCSLVRHCQILQCQVLHFQRPHPSLLVERPRPRRAGKLPSTPICQPPTSSSHWRLTPTAQPTYLQQTFWMLWVVGQLQSRETHATRLFFGSAFLFYYSDLTLFWSARPLSRPAMRQTYSHSDSMFLTFFLLTPGIYNNNNNHIATVWPYTGVPGWPHSGRPSEYCQYWCPARAGLEKRWVFS